MVDITKSKEYETQFDEFFRDFYMKDISRVSRAYPDRKSIVIDYRVLEEYDPEIADALVDNPDFILECARVAMLSLPDIGKLARKNEGEHLGIHIRVNNMPDDKKLKIKEVTSDHIGKLIAISGIVNKITGLHPKVAEACFKCQRCGRE